MSFTVMVGAANRPPRTVSEPPFVNAAELATLNVPPLTSINASSTETAPCAFKVPLRTKTSPLFDTVVVLLAVNVPPLTFKTPRSIENAPWALNMPLESTLSVPPVMIDVKDVPESNNPKSATVHSLPRVALAAPSWVIVEPLPLTENDLLEPNEFRLAVPPERTLSDTEAVAGPVKNAAPPLSIDSVEVPALLPLTVSVEPVPVMCVAQGKSCR